MNSLVVNLGGTGKVYKQFLYPAGEMQVRLNPECIEYVRSADEVRLISRISSASDIMELVLLVDAIRGVADPDIQLILPYLPYGRADRRFTDGDCHGLKVFGDTINSLGLDQVVTLDAHSEGAALRYVGKCINVSPSQFIERSIVGISRRAGKSAVQVIFPDEGAARRYNVPLFIGSNQEVVQTVQYHCAKKRDPITGKLLGFDVPAIQEGLPVLIVDDICDGGGTFLGIANNLTTLVPELCLYVTHGIFSQGHAKLEEAFDRIYTTNTLLPENVPGFVTYFDALPALLSVL